MPVGDNIEENTEQTSNSSRVASFVPTAAEWGTRGVDRGKATTLQSAGCRFNPGVATQNGSCVSYCASWTDSE